MESIKLAYHRYLRYFLAKDNDTATNYDKYMALAYAVRSEMVDKWIETQKRYRDSNIKRVYYLSMEYVLGKSLKHNIIYAGLLEGVQETARDLGFSLDDIFAQEDDFDLGNGGKGRIAACFQDSLATLGIAATGYGLRYDYGAFRQEIKEDAQSEAPYDWLHKGHPWEIIRPEYACTVNFYGTVTGQRDNAKPRMWEDTENVIAIPYDMPIPGFNSETVNTLRLWSARASEKFLPDYQNHGDYTRACEEKSQSSTVTRMLFPDEDVVRGTEQRLKQQFFFVSATLQNIVRRFKAQNTDLSTLDSKVVIQINGSGCAIAVPELLRILVDVEGMEWNDAWRVTRNVFAYTSHAVGKDDCESWPIYKLAEIFPRHIEIIFEINQRHLDSIRKRNDERLTACIPALSLVEEGEVKRIRMAHLAVLGSSSVNGVSREQSTALLTKIFPEFALVNTNKFTNVTNGIMHRRWLLGANSNLGTIISNAIGTDWITNASKLSLLAPLARDASFQHECSRVKKIAKLHLCKTIKTLCNLDVNPEALFDIQAKKIHPYKRQVLNVLGILYRYLNIKQGNDSSPDRVHIFTGKAAPSDRLAKQIVHLIHVVASIINNDASINNKLKIVFIPDYGMSLAEVVIPGADLTEQIATPGMEACGTSIVKFIINGAIPIASHSGINTEITESCQNALPFVFGHTLQAMPTHHDYKPWEIIRDNPLLSEIFEFLDNHLSTIPDGHAIFPLLASLRDNDEYFTLLDFSDYICVQEGISKAWQNTASWQEDSIQLMACVCKFSADSAVLEYARTIWKVATRA